MNLVGSREKFTRSEEEMFARFADAEISPRSGLIKALQKDNPLLLSEKLEEAHEDLGFAELLLGIVATANTQRCPAALVTLVGRVYTMSAYSESWINSLFEVCQNPKPPLLAAFLEKFYGSDDRECDQHFISTTFTRIAPHISPGISKKELIQQFPRLFNSRHMPIDLQVPILHALFYLTSRNRPEVFDEEAVAKSPGCSEFVLSFLKHYFAVSDPDRWSRRAIDIFCANIPPDLSEEYCLRFARVNTKVVLKWLENQQMYRLQFVIDLIAQIGKNDAHKHELFKQLENADWQQDVVQLHPVPYYEQFIRNVRALTSDTDFFIHKSIHSILNGIVELAEKQNALIKKLNESTKIEWLKSTLIEHKIKALGVVFTLASQSRNRALTSNLYAARLLELKITDKPNEPMVSRDNVKLALTFLGYSFA